MQLKNIQILLETITRCGGNCSGCALSSLERMTKSSIDFDKFTTQQLATHKHLSQYVESQVESISIFLGQGDHFLMDDLEIEPFVELCSKIVPDNMKHKTVIFITASAIGKNDTIRYKMDLFYEYSIKYEIPFFIQVVFDPKKMLITDNFRKIYLENILYFKQKCGMTELTLNLGEDLYQYISPQMFHDWILEHGFKHVEMNWVINNTTHLMWKNSAEKMFEWLEQWLTIYKNQKLYEINFIPFLGRSFLDKDISFMDMKEKINNILKENLYIDNNDNVFLCQMGLISNLTPMGERLIKNNNKLEDVEILAQKETTKVMRNILKNPVCNSCEYQNICATSGSTAWFSYKDNESSECPWNIKKFLKFFENNFVDNNDSLGETIFHKNPVQSDNIMKENNATHLYFENNI